jgi:hypothetical protein
VMAMQAAASARSTRPPSIVPNICGAPPCRNVLYRHLMS